MVCFLSPACLDRAIEMPVTAVTVNDRGVGVGGKLTALDLLVILRIPRSPNTPRVDSSRSKTWETSLYPLAEFTRLPQDAVILPLARYDGGGGGVKSN